MPSMKTHPLTGKPIVPLGTRLNGTLIWPVLGASEHAVEDQQVAPPETVTIPVPVPTPSPPQSFSAEDIAKARQEEKSKLYKQIEDQRSKIQGLEKFQQTFEQEAEAARNKAADDARQQAEAEAAARWEESDAKTQIATATQEWEARFASLEAERESERAVFAREQEFNRLREYARTKVSEALADNQIAPELADYVSGNNESEIDASLEFAKAKTEAILTSITQAQTQARASMRGVSTAGFSTTGPMDTESGHKSYTAAELASLSMSEYAKIRGSLLPGLQAQQSNRGLYG